MSTLFQRNRLSVLEQVMKIVYMGHRCCIPIKHQFWNMNYQFNGKIEKRHPPPHLTGHEVYEMVRMSMLSTVSRKGLARILKKMTYGRSSLFFGSYRHGKT
jgi:hypothetical protein